jgi:arsenate reductase
MGKLRVLFVCVHNSARSQMAEAFMNDLAGDIFQAESAGMEPGVINPVVVEVMKEIGYDLSNNQTKGVYDFFKQGKSYHYVISVCDEANAQRCPTFPGLTRRISWSFEDPASFTGSDEEKKEQTRLVRDKIKTEVKDFINTYNQTKF